MCVCFGHCEGCTGAGGYRDDVLVQPQRLNQFRKMSQLRGDNRSNSHVHFCMCIAPFRIFNIIYHISSDRSQVSNTSWVSNTSRGLLLDKIWSLPANIYYVLYILKGGMPVCKYSWLLLLLPPFDCDICCCLIGE